MNGQWIGGYAGSSDGQIIVNIDERSSFYQGVAYLHSRDKSLPAVAGGFRTSNKSASFQFRTDWLYPVHPLSGLTDTWENVKHFYGGDVVVSQYADVTGSWTSEMLSLSW